MHERTSTIDERTDPELVALTASGDARAFGELYRRHLPAAKQRARRFAGNLPDAEDLVSSAFTSVLNAIRHGRRPHHFRSYLLTAIFSHACKLTVCRQRCRPVEDIDANALWADDHTGRADPATTWTVRQAFRSLPPRWRLTLWLTAVEGRPPAELATVLNTSANAAAAVAVRARRGLLCALQPSVLPVTKAPVPTRRNHQSSTSRDFHALRPEGQLICMRPGIVPNALPREQR